MKISDNGARLIESFEGFRANPYRDAVGVWTIGYGTTKGVGPGTPAMSRQEAHARLMREVDRSYGAAINALGLPLNQNQFDALVSFVYNVGPGGVAASTTVGKRLRARDWRGAADAMLAWDHAGGKRLAGLTRRRQAERKLFLQKASPAGAQTTADSLAGYTDRERGWIHEFDRLRRRADPVSRARARVLVDAMARQRKRIWKLAQPPAHGGDGRGWEYGHRRRRYRSLLARTV